MYFSEKGNFLLMQTKMSAHFLPVPKDTLASVPEMQVNKELEDDIPRSLSAFYLLMHNDLLPFLFLNFPTGKIGVILSAS